MALTGKARVAFIRGVCQVFIQTLIDHEYIEDLNLFSLLSEEAEKKGYDLEARQFKDGTEVIFTKRKG